MTIAAFLSRRRRELALCGASVLLHLLALAWIVPQLGLASAPAPAAPLMITARLLPEPPQPPPPPPPAVPPKRVRAPVRKPPPARPPVAQAAVADEAPAALEQSGAAEKLSDVQSIQTATEETAPPVAAPADVPAAAPEPAAPPPRQYRVDVPPSSRIVLDVERTDADGTLWHGEAAMAWQRSGDSYHLKVEAGIRLLIARVNLVVLESEGKVGAAGFAPVTMTEKRRGRALTATHFGDGNITFSASQGAVPMLPGTQDKATVPLQLAAIARGDNGQLSGDIEMLVGEDKDASVFHFVVLGEEELDTGLGRMTAWHLSRPPRAGSYGSRLDIWLAPGHGWYPVKIRNTEASGAVTTQTVNKIQITEAGT